MLKRMGTGVFLAVLCLAGLCGSSAAATPSSLELKPNQVTIGATYNGTTVAVNGTIPADAQVAIEMVGKPEEIELLKKEHVFGVLWMNNGTITMANMPELYLLYTPAGLSVEQLNRLDLGFKALKQRAKIEPDPGDERDKWVEEFFKLKDKEDLYVVSETAVEYQPEGSRRAFHCDLHLPSGIRWGHYKVNALVIRNNQVYQKVSEPLEVKVTGLPAFMQSMAYNHAVLYGVLATVIAITAGLLISFIFRGEGGAH